MYKKNLDVKKINYKEKFDLSNKVVIITGGCGLIGKSLCEAVAQFGANVVIIDIEKTNPKSYAEDLSNRYNRKMLGDAIDVTNLSNMNLFKEKILSTYNKIDGLMNFHQNKTENFFEPFENYTVDNWDAVVNTNLKGTFISCQVFGTWMAKNGGGSIINIPSIYSIVAPNQNLYNNTKLGCPAAYSASKGGISALSKYLASYWANKKVRVNMVTPHGVWNNHEIEFEENFKKLSPMRRMSHNHEVVGAFIYLLSEASSYVTGENIKIDGGWTVW